MRRADRLFDIIQALRQSKLVRAKDLAEQLEVSERTIYRDIAARAWAARSCPRDSPKQPKAPTWRNSRRVEWNGCSRRLQPGDWHGSDIGMTQFLGQPKLRAMPRSCQRGNGVRVSECTPEWPFIDSRIVPLSAASRQDPAHQVPVDVRQAVVPSLMTKRESFVIEAKAMEDRGVQVVQMNCIPRDVVRELVGFAEHRPGPHPTACQPH